MRAERFRGSRIRSPSWRNELIEKDIRQKSPAVPGFFFWRTRCYMEQSVQNSCTPVFLLVATPSYDGKGAYDSPRGPRRS